MGSFLLHAPLWENHHCSVLFQLHLVQTIVQCHLLENQNHNKWYQSDYCHLQVQHWRLKQGCHWQIDQLLYNIKEKTHAINNDSNNLKSTSDGRDRHKCWTREWEHHILSYAFNLVEANRWSGFYPESGIWASSGLKHLHTSWTTVDLPSITVNTRATCCLTLERYPCGSLIAWTRGSGGDTDIKFWKQIHVLKFIVLATAKHKLLQYELVIIWNLKKCLYKCGCGAAYSVLS